MRVVHVASEVAPWAQTGGLADVVGALPGALARVAGGALEVAVIAPLHRAVAETARRRGVTLTPTGVAVSAYLGGAHLEGRMVAAEVSGEPRLYFLDCPALFDRPSLYGGPDGDFADNAVRFAMLARAAIDAAPRLLGGPPELLHAHDWQAGLVPVYLAAVGEARPRCVFTVHNLAYQGLVPLEAAPSLGLDPSSAPLAQLEFFGSLSPLKAGLSLADAVTTVSPSYAAEILEPEHGCGLHEVLAHDVRRLVGIVNGIDLAVWDPATDEALPARFSRGDLAGKARCRRALADELELPLGADDLLCVVISRFAEQKGLDLVADVVPELHGIGVRLAVLGSGDPALEERYLWLAERFRDHLAVRVGFDVPLSRRMYGAADALLMPSRFEPCGLNQMYAMRYGTVPVVRAVGGLRDTVIDADVDPARATGLCFSTASAVSLHAAVRRAAELHRERPERWAAMVDRGMARDSAWDASARAYLALYRELCA